MSRSITILYGTETFTAEGYAERTGEALEELGYEVTVTDMEDFEPEDLATLRTLLIITSTYGNGDPPASAEPLHEHVMADTAPHMPNLRFSVCGLGDTTYPHFAQCGKDFDRRLLELGGHRITERQDCDVDIDPPWEEWLERLKTTLDGLSWDTPSEEAPAAAPVADAPTAASQTAAAPAPAVEAPAPDAGATATASALHRRCGPPANASAPVARRRNPAVVTVAVNQSLTGDGASRDVRHLELDLTGSGLTYLPGDSIGLFAPNDPALVDAILEATGADPDTPVTQKSETLTLRDAMTTRLDIHEADPKLADAIAAAGGTVLGPDGPAVHVIDAVSHAGVPLDGPTLFGCLRRQAPRLYSVASSPSVHPDHVHLVASVVRYDAYGRPRSGVATGWMADRMPEGCSVRAYLQPLETFRLADDATDIIMIGPGTGIAPFRAFLQEREHRRARGRSWLLFGSRNRATDYLYRDELENWRHRGLLTRLDLAFSRDQDTKVYVQDKLLAQAKAVWSWLQKGAIVYVCGDAKAMAPDVHRALQQIAREEGGMDKDEARTWIRDLAQNERYMRDVY
jgi:sulfite reductase (NADPH) flavoprotein alpha-component